MDRGRKRKREKERARHMYTDWFWSEPLEGPSSYLGNRENYWKAESKRKIRNSNLCMLNCRCLLMLRQRR